MTTLTFTRDPSEEHHVDEPREEEWLPIIGPTSWLLGQLLTRQLTTERRVEWDAVNLGKRLGVKAEGKHSPLLSAVSRLERFGIIAEDYDAAGDFVYVVRRGWGPARSRRTVNAARRQA